MLNQHQKAAVYVMLRRRNPGLPPSCRWGKAQRRLSMAIEIALGNFTQSAAFAMLDAAKTDPLLKDLAGRLASFLFDPRAPVTPAPLPVAEALAWWTLYVETGPDGKPAPKNWEQQLPTGATTESFSVKVSPAIEAVIQAACEISNVTYADGVVTPNGPLPGGLCRVLNRLAKAQLPSPAYRGNGWEYKEYQPDKTLLAQALALARVRANMAERARRTVYRAVRRHHDRSCWSGRIECGGMVSGTSRACEVKPHEVSVRLGRWADSIDDRVAFRIASAASAAIRGVPMPA